MLSAQADVLSTSASVLPEERMSEERVLPEKRMPEERVLPPRSLQAGVPGSCFL